MRDWSELPVESWMDSRADCSIEDARELYGGEITH